MRQRISTPSGLRQRVTQVREVDRITMGIIAAGVAIVLAIVFPRVIPAAKRGVECTSLPAPIGGNNRSLLAQVGEDQQNLELNITLEKETIGLNESLKVKVTIVNHDIGPAILYFNNQQSRPPITSDVYAVGLRFEITRLDGSFLIDQGIQAPPDPAWTTGSGYARITQWVEPNSLHLLGSRSRCTLEYSYNLNQSGALTPADYRIRAYYYNNNIGATRPFNPDLPTVTATAAYVDQGIWVGSASSEEIRFTVGGP